MQDRAMQVSQSRSRLRDMPVPGAVCEPRTPDLMAEYADQGEHGGENRKGGGEAQAAAGKTERGRGTTHNSSANRYKGDG